MVKERRDDVMKAFAISKVRNYSGLKLGGRQRRRGQKAIAPAKLPSASVPCPENRVVVC